MSTNNRNRRWALGMDVAVGAAFVAAMIALANEARADTPDLDPFEDLFGTSGINTWTPTADTDLGALAGGLDTSVDNFFQADYFTLFGGFPTFTLLTDLFDPSAFSGPPALGGFPDDAIGDLAVGLDYTLSATGLGWLDLDLGLLLGPLFTVPA